MRKNAIIMAIALLLAAGLVASTYSLWKCQKKSERLIDSVYIDSIRSVEVLSDMANFLNGSIETNASDDYLMFQLILYDEHAIFLGKILFDLYEQTGEKKYYTLYTAVSNVVSFLTDVSNDGPTKMRARVKDNFYTLKQIQELFKELSKYQKPEEIPEDLAEELLNASRKLK